MLNCLVGMALIVLPTKTKHLGLQLDLGKLAPGCGCWLDKLIRSIPLGRQLRDALVLHVVAWCTLKT
ncbi:hypothetical protein D3C72_2395900 [compost metagenome]